MRARPAGLRAARRGGPGAAACLHWAQRGHHGRCSPGSQQLNLCLAAMNFISLASKLSDLHFAAAACQYAAVQACTNVWYAGSALLLASSCAFMAAISRAGDPHLAHALMQTLPAALCTAAASCRARLAEGPSARVQRFRAPSVHLCCQIAERHSHSSVPRVASCDFGTGCSLWSCFAAVPLQPLPDAAYKAGLQPWTSQRRLLLAVPLAVTRPELGADAVALRHRGLLRFVCCLEHGRHST